MKVRDILIGVIFLAILLALIIVAFRKVKLTPNKILPNPTASPSVEENIERRFNVTIPQSAQKAELMGVGGNGQGVATREKENNQNLYTILADLEDPPAGQSFWGWLVRGKPGEGNYAVVSLGQLRVAKGGWLTELKTATDYSDYKTVVVSQETRLPKTPGKHVLEGSF